MKTNLLFVYGTLKTGGYNNYFLDGCDLYFTGKTLNKYTMISLGTYPALTYGDTSQIHGEVYQITVPVLKEINQLEVPYGYNRNIVEVISDSGDEVVKAFCYIAGPELTQRLEASIKAEGNTKRIVSSGNWNVGSSITPRLVNAS